MGKEQVGLEQWRAFISYRISSPRDNWLAHALQRALERYRTPRRLAQNGVADRIGRVFINDEEISGGMPLRQSLAESVERCEYLIVIVSSDALPHPDRDDFIQEEISVYRKTHLGVGRIIPVLSSGSADLLAGMGFHEPHDAIAVDLTAWRRWSFYRDQSEFLRVVAPLINCRYADLRQRERLRARRRGAAVTAAATLFGAVSVVAGLNWYRAEQQKRIATSRLDDALSVARLVFSTADEELQRVHGADRVRRKLTQATGEMVQRLLSEEAARRDPTVLRVRSTGHTAAGEEAWRSGDVSQAMREYQFALALDEQLLKLDPRGDSRQSDVAVSHLRLARIYALRGDLARLQDHARRALAHAEAALRARPTDGFLMHGVAAAYGQLAVACYLEQNWDVALSLLARRLHYASRSAAIEPGDVRYAMTPAQVDLELAEVYKSQGRLSSAKVHARSAVDKFSRLRARFSEDPDIVRALYLSHVQFCDHSPDRRPNVEISGPHEYRACHGGGSPREAAGGRGESDLTWCSRVRAWWFAGECRSLRRRRTVRQAGL